MTNRQKVFNVITVGFIMPLLLILGATFFKDRSFLLISILIASFSLVLVFITFEKKETPTRRLVVLATLIAISVIGRVIFVAVPGFKPVTAIVVIAGIFFGPEAGFLVGSLSALVSNVFFGQGPWTPFQMVAWGLLGFLAGLPYIREKLRTNRLLLSIYGVFAGVSFSLIMDIWTTMSLDGTFKLNRYITLVSLSIPFMIVYAISNVVFLLLIIKPIGNTLTRLKRKYGI